MVSVNKTKNNITCVESFDWFYKNTKDYFHYYDTVTMLDRVKKYTTGKDVFTYLLVFYLIGYPINKKGLPINFNLYEKYLNGDKFILSKYNIDSNKKQHMCILKFKKEEDRQEYIDYINSKVVKDGGRLYNPKNNSL